MIFTLVSYGIYKVFYAHNVSVAENEAVNLGQMLFEQEINRFIVYDTNGDATLKIGKKQLKQLDEKIHNHLKPLKISKIKLFSKDTEIVYSTDQEIIGRTDSNNPKLKKALSGHVVSNLEKKDVTDIKGEKSFSFDVVEAYIPVRDKKGQIVGSFEVYLDITRYRDELKAIMAASMKLISAVLLFVFGFFYILMRKSVNKLTQAEKSLKLLSITDGLTGIYNRRYLLSRVEEEFERQKRLNETNKSVMSVGYMMVDIDHFKEINDTYGHQCGDSVLKELSNRLSNSLRRYDVIGRYGGEEFLIILPNTEPDEIRRIAERIWKTVREEPFYLNKTLSCAVTVSIGISCLSKRDKDIKTAIKRADEALYKAKEMGRDRIVCIMDEDYTGSADNKRNVLHLSEKRVDI